MRCPDGISEYLLQIGQRYGFSGGSMMMRQGRMNLWQCGHLLIDVHWKDACRLTFDSANGLCGYDRSIVERRDHGME
jgi:hypothetical protein